MLAHLLYSFVTEEYPQVFIKTYQKNLRVPCLFRCLIFKVRCLLKKGRFVSYHIIAALSTPFFLPVRVFPPAPLLPVGIPFQGCALPALFALPFGSPLEECLIILSNHSPFVNIFFLLFLPLFTPLRALREQQGRGPPRKMKIKLNKRGALFFILIIVYPSIMSLI